MASGTVPDKGEEDPCGSSSSSSSTTSTSTCCGGEEAVAAVAAELLDEYWFFHNRPSVGLPRTLHHQNKGKAKVVSDTCEAGVIFISTKPPANDRLGGRNSPRTPSLPPNIGKEKATGDETTLFKLSITKITCSYSSVQKATSSPCHETRQDSPLKSVAKQSSPRHANLEKINRYYNHHHKNREGDARRALQMKKWKSLSDLEHEELQGFKDLGFVFDNNKLSPVLLSVIPGLRGRSPDGSMEEEGSSRVRRPYLSETWLLQSSAPPVLNWVSRRSASDMKEQLRFWARAVAFNLRQDC